MTAVPCVFLTTPTDLNCMRHGVTPPAKFDPLANDPFLMGLTLSAIWQHDFDVMMGVIAKQPDFATLIASTPYGGHQKSYISIVPQQYLMSRGVDVAKVDLYEVARRFKDDLKQHGWNATALVVYMENGNLTLEAQGFGLYKP